MTSKIIEHSNESQMKFQNLIIADSMALDL